MAVLFPLGFKIDEKIYTLWVNPTQIVINRNASIAEARTFGGTVLRPWTNYPDTLEIQGDFYGLRGLDDLLTLKETIRYDPFKKQVELIYKWQKYKGFVKNFTITASAENPLLFKYELSFVSLDSFKLYSLMIGNLPGIGAEISYFEQQKSNVKKRLSDAGKDVDIYGPNFINTVVNVAYFSSAIPKENSVTFKEVLSNKNWINLAVNAATLIIPSNSSSFLNFVKSSATTFVLLYSIKTKIALNRYE
ncbi:MAG: hypothetical protein QXK49_04125 [Candidatus Aenigmatarchaeota archaeon]